MTDHELNYRTETDEHICVCGRYFATKKEFEEHLDEVDDYEWTNINWGKDRSNDEEQ